MNRSNIKSIEVIHNHQNNLILFEFMGEFENDDMFNGIYNKDTLQLVFSNFYLQGKKIQKQFIILEKIDNKIIVLQQVKEVILFNTEPRFISRNNLIPL